MPVVGCAQRHLVGERTVVCCASPWIRFDALDASWAGPVGSWRQARVEVEVIPLLLVHLHVGDRSTCHGVETAVRKRALHPEGQPVGAALARVTWGTPALLLLLHCPSEPAVDQRDRLPWLGHLISDLSRA
eukprot:745652-Hanusia_phi.AAC.8